ncbi:MAG: SPFH domain-containing protein [Clostridia bacterium]|nr:SPFH domain-containing protein [Clostridia bacterium]
MIGKSKKALKVLKNTTNNLATIKYDGDNSTFIWKHPEEDFQIGSQLIVHESQEAIFFLNGEALDTFGPGRHTLTTENLPLLNKVFNFVTKTDIPFHAEIYFINYSTQMGIKWGTDSRVRFVDPFTKIPFDIGASGEISLKVTNGRKLLVSLVGVSSGLLRNDFTEKGDSSSSVVKNAVYYKLSDFFRAPMMTEIKSHLAEAIVSRNINILEIDMHLESLSIFLKDKVKSIFEAYGLEVPQFYVSNVSLPEDDRNFQDLKALQTKIYLDVKAEEVRQTIAMAQRERKITEEETASQIEIIRAKNQADIQKISAEATASSERMKGLAEAEVMREKGYSEKDVIAADVQKAYAESLGKINSNLGAGGSGGAAGGGVAGDFINLAVGMKMAEAVVGKMDNFNIPAEEPTPSSTARNTWVCSCGCNENTGNFCGECGAPRPTSWTCPACGHSGNRHNFCENCGTAKPVAAWKCEKCGFDGNSGLFCGNCGAKKQSN